ncbi:magnesium transporter MRS2-F-like [Eucalyptus grandis]|uniref:magnesium transporter MRS2-F-like n=1 Tax=Eucalyptus grandis TaxID=71139 RepID=UPI00192EA632|nr:magnesium transporter MRS2-F-like [Eucalyptus grandis]
MAPPARSLANVIYLDGAPRIKGGGQTGVEEIGRVAMVQAQQPWRKLIGTRAWLIVSESGQLHVEEIEKHSIMGWTGLPARNLLVLDLVLSYPSSILGREQAEVDGKTLPASGVHKTLPFEFRALESCLESACRCLESETMTLEDEAYPALDELTSKISTLNLDRVRQIKSHLVAISGRVQKVRDELEHLLDDDNDMAEMYLTEKLLTHSLDNASIREEVDNAAPEIDDERAEDYNEEDDTVVLTSYKPNIEELEMLLEAYFVQIYCTLQKLSDTTDYHN